MDIKIKGETTEKKFKHLEIILSRMYRRVHHTLIGVMPQIPIFDFCPEPLDGLVGRYIIPEDCKFTSVDFFVGRPKLDTDAKGNQIIIVPEFHVSVNRGGFTTKSVICQDQPFPTDMKMELKKGDILELTTQQDIKEISFSVVLDFGDKLNNSQEFLIEELENLLEAGKYLEDEGV